MTEASDTGSNQVVDLEELRYLNELITSPDIVYHGIGADIVALSGIAKHGIVSESPRPGASKATNPLAPRGLVNNGGNQLANGAVPPLAIPDEVFYTRTNHSSISFAIRTTSDSSRPHQQTHFDQAFIGAKRHENIVGVVVDSESMNRRLVGIPILDSNFAVDGITAKAHSYFDFITHQLDHSLEGSRMDLDAQLKGIAHLGSLGYGADISGEDIEKIADIDRWLRNKLAIALTHTFGNADMTVLEAVKINFPNMPIFVNNHDAAEPISGSHDPTTLITN